MLPHSQIMAKTTISKIQWLSVRSFLHALLPLVLSHGLSFFLHGLLLKGIQIYSIVSNCLNCNSDGVAPNSGRPRNIKGPFWFTWASHCAVDPPTALSVVRLVLSDTKLMLDTFY